jgi:DNA invertase Pin-like site-specific DNA recombinase
MTMHQSAPTDAPQKGDSAASIPAVVYAAKSTQDRRRSIDTQLEDARWKCAEEGWDIIGRPFSDEGFSAYRGNRGPDLAAAIEFAAAEAARRGAPVMLVAQAVDRVARGAGDAPNSARHASELWHELRRRDVWMRTAEDDEATRDAGSIAAAGEAAMRESRRRSSATRKGLRRRAGRGEAVGAIPFGYRAQVVIENGQAVTRRVIDPEAAALVERIMAAVESGRTFGDVSRALNAEGARTVRGGHWTTRAVRRVVLNEDYTGSTGYPPIMDADRWERIVAGVRRMDPAAVQARKGGRRPSEAYLLRGVAFCSACGAAMYTHQYASVGRAYRCANVIQATGLCDTPAIPAATVEAKALEHLADFKLDVDAWLRDRAAEMRVERAGLEREAARLRDEVRRIDRRIRGTRRQHEAALDAGEDDLAATALREIARYEDELRGKAAEVREKEAQVEEWTAEPEIDAALDYYNEIQELIAGRLSRARGAVEINAALRSLLDGAWMVRNDRQGVVVDFVLRGQPRVVISGPDDALTQPRAEDRTVVRVDGKTVESWPIDLPSEPDHRPSCTST